MLHWLAWRESVSTITNKECTYYRVFIVLELFADSLPRVDQLTFFSVVLFLQTAYTVRKIWEGFSKMLHYVETLTQVAKRGMEEENEWT